MIEVDYTKRSTSTIYFSSSLKTYVDEKYGEIIVYHEDGQPLGGVYIKVFSQYKDGRTDYYKDGYTDSVGRFYYATLNMNILG